MSKYASLLFAPDKYHEIGPFRFPIYNDLVPGESKRIEEISRKQSKATFRSISTKEALELLTKAGDDENQDILYDYASELEELQRENLGATEQQIAFVTLFMRYRGEAKLPRSKDWSKLEDWSEVDTEAMPRKLMEGVFELILWERDGWPEPEAAGNDPEPEPEFSPPPSKS